MEQMRECGGSVLQVRECGGNVIVAENMNVADALVLQMCEYGGKCVFHIRG